MDDPKYATFSESEAADILRKCLDYFFADDDGRKRYKYSEAYLKYTKFADENYVTAKRLYNVIKLTQLLSDKLILRVTSITGQIYLIDKKYMANVNRHVRFKNRETTPAATTDDVTNNERTSEHTPSPTSTSSFVEISNQFKTPTHKNPTPSPPSGFAQPQLDNASTGQLSMEDTWEDMNRKVAHRTPQVTKTPVPMPANDVNVDIPVPASVTKITNMMENDIANMMQDITTHQSSDTMTLQTEMKNFISTEINQIWSTKLSDINLRIVDLDNRLNSVKEIEDTYMQRNATLEQEYAQKNDKVHKRLHWVNAKMDEYEKKFTNKFENDLRTSIESIQEKFDGYYKKCVSKLDDQMQEFHTTHQEVSAKVTSLTRSLEQSNLRIVNMESDTIPTAKTLNMVTSNLKTLAKDYATRVEIMDATVDFIRNEFSQIKETHKTTIRHELDAALDTFRQSFQHKKFPSLDDNRKNTVTPQRQSRHAHKKGHRHSFVPFDNEDDSSSESELDHSRSSRSKRGVPLYQGVRTDVIRKNVRISCPDETQLLDFYTKLRTAMIQAGVYLRELTEINDDDDIFEYKDGLTRHDYTLQSNALYSFLCNEDVIPQDFVFAQNCLKSQSTSMDGFSTLKSMLSLVHPILNNRRPPNHPPLYSSSNDLHLYEQSLRNFYLLHSIYGRSEYSELDKSKQFLEGLDTSEYDSQKTRLTAIIDNIELNSLSLPQKYTIHALASTIMNMNTTENQTVQINALWQRKFPSTEHRTGTFQRGNSTRLGKKSYNASPKYNSPYSDTHKNHGTQDFANSFPPKQKFTKGQCDACKLFGHHVRDCRHIAKHLAMTKFANEKPKLCEQILRNHINTNTVEHKRTIVRSMQTFGLFNADDDSDEFLDVDAVINSPVVNTIQYDANTENEHDE